MRGGTEKTNSGQKTDDQACLHNISKHMCQATGYTANRMKKKM